MVKLNGIMAIMNMWLKPEIVLEYYSGVDIYSYFFYCYTMLFPLSHAYCSLDCSQGDMVLPQHILCLTITRHAVTLFLAHVEASPLAVNVLPSLCMFFSCLSLAGSTFLDFNLDITGACRVLLVKLFHHVVK